MSAVDDWRRLLESLLLVLCQRILTKPAKMTSLYFTHESKEFAPKTPQNDENDETGGGTRAKAWFTENRHFCNPEAGGLSFQLSIL